MSNREQIWMVILTGAALAGTATANAQIITNGGFEAGLTGWTVANETGSDGEFFSQTGPTSPVNGFAVPAPPEGTRAAMTDAQAGGSHVLYQDFVVPAFVPGATVSFSLFLNNMAESYATAANLDWASTNQQGQTILNQQARVDIMAAGSGAFAVDAASVLMNLFQTGAQTPLVTGYNSFSIDLTSLLQAHAGQTLRLRFAETDNINFFNLGVDDVRINVVPEPGTWLAVLVLCRLATQRRN